MRDHWPDLSRVRARNRAEVERALEFEDSGLGPSEIARRLKRPENWWVMYRSRLGLPAHQEQRDITDDDLRVIYEMRRRGATLEMISIALRRGAGWCATMRQTNPRVSDAIDRGELDGKALLRRRSQEESAPIAKSPVQRRTDERKAEALRRLRLGDGRRQIARDLGVSPQWVAQTMRTDPVFAGEAHEATAAARSTVAERGAALLRSGMSYAEVGAELERSGRWAKRHLGDVPGRLTPLEGRVVRAFEAGPSTCHEAADAAKISYRSMLIVSRRLLRRGVLVDTGRTVLVRGNHARVLRPASGGEP